MARKLAVVDGKVVVVDDSASGPTSPVPPTPEEIAAVRSGPLIGPHKPTKPVGPSELPPIPLTTTAPVIPGKAAASEPPPVPLASTAPALPGAESSNPVPVVIVPGSSPVPVTTCTSIAPAGVTDKTPFPATATAPALTAPVGSTSTAPLKPAVGRESDDSMEWTGRHPSSFVPPGGKPVTYPFESPAKSADREHGTYAVGPALSKPATGPTVPKRGPVEGKPGDSRTTVYDRPMPVVIVGPRPVPVIGMGPTAGTGGATTTAPATTTASSGTTTTTQGSAAAGNPLALPTDDKRIVARAVGQFVAGKASGDDDAGRKLGGTVGYVAGEAIGEAAGGPVGAAVGGPVGSMVGDKIGARLDDPLKDFTDTFKTATKVTTIFADGMKAVAGNDYLGAFQVGVKAGGDVLGQIPVVGKAASAALETFGTAVTATVGVVNAFTERGKQLAMYSGQLTAATATADIRGMQSDLREADVLGPKLAELIDLQSRFEQVFREIMLPIKEVVLGAIIELLKGIAEVLLKILENIQPIVKFFSDAAGAGVAGLIVRIRALLEGHGPGLGLDPRLLGWIGAPVGGVAAPAPAPAAGAIPLLRGLGLIP